MELNNVEVPISDVTKRDKEVFSLLDFDPSRLVFSPVETTTYEDKTKLDENGKPMKGENKRLPCKYNYGIVPELPMVGDIIFRLPRMIAKGGIRIKPEMGKVNYSVMLVFSKDNPLHNSVLEKLNELHYAIGLKCYEERYKLKMNNFMKDSQKMMVATGLKFPVYYATNKENGEIIQGVPPAFYLKLVTGGEYKTTFKSLSTTMDSDQDINWLDITKVDIDMEPEILLTHVHAGSMMSMQFRLSAGIVYDISKSEGKVRSQHHAASIAAQNPGVKDNIENKIAIYRNLRLATEAKPNIGGSESENGTASKKPTFAVVNELDGNKDTSRQNIPQAFAQQTPQGGSHQNIPQAFAQQTPQGFSQQNYPQAFAQQTPLNFGMVPGMTPSQVQVPSSDIKIE